MIIFKNNRKQKNFKVFVILGKVAGKTIPRFIMFHQYTICSRTQNNSRLHQCCNNKM